MRDNHGRATFGATGLDEELEMIRDQFRRYADEKVIPFAHDWHLKDELIPMEVIGELAEMGVFGLTIPEEFGGFGLSKASMVRGVRGTVARLYRRRLARHPQRDRRRADPVRRHAASRRQKWLPKLASGEILPTAVFTEPNTGSDLGSLRTRAVRTATPGDHRQQDLDHPCRAHRCDDAAGPHRPRHDRLSRACRCSWPKRPAAPTPTPSPPPA
jgi:(2S)-methylsuccinyl-CoA dehydrogenase